MEKNGAAFFIRLGLVFLAAVAMAPAQFTETDIPTATRDTNGDGIPDDTSTIFRVRGRISSPDFVGTPGGGDEFAEIYVQDSTVAGGINAGVLVYFDKPTPAEDPGFDAGGYQLGREVEITATVSQVNGVTTMVPAVPSLHFTVTDTNSVPVAPTVRTISALLAASEDYESTLVRINGITFSGTPSLPALGNTASISVTDGTGTLTMRIDEDTDIPGQLPPGGSFDLVGVFSQFDNSEPFTSGYQILPRFYSDFVQSSANVAPQLVLPPAGSIVGRPGQEVALTVLAQDLNTDDTLTITVPGAPASSTLTPDPQNPRFATFRWTPGPADAGSTTVLTFMVDDGTTSASDPYHLVVLSESLSDVLINEVLYDPPSGVPTGDANGDGTRSASEDEFIEIYNAGTGQVDISGWTLELDTGTLFTFPVATSLAAETAAVVFGGGSPTGAFGGAQVFSAGGWSPVLSNSGSGGPIRLRTDGGVTVDTLDYSEFSSDPNASLTRDPDGTFSGFVEHDSLGALLFSPGTKSDGAAFDGTGITNTPPVVDPVEDLAVRIGETVLVSVSASDVDGNPLTLSVANEPAGAVFTDHGNGTATLEYTGEVADAGISFPLEFTADDGLDTDSENMTLDVPTLLYSGLFINELLPDPDLGATHIDSNNDGVHNSSHDEFIEIVNLTQGPLNLLGCTLSDAFSTRHTFPSLVVPRGGSVVVFGGGSLANFTASPAQVASSGSLGLNNSGDAITLRDPAGILLDVVRYADPGVPDGASLNRDPDLSFGPFATHSELAGASGPASPGTWFDGTPFLTNPPSGLFSYRVIGFEVEITDYPTTQVGAITVPDTIESLPVTRIGDYAFDGCSGLTGITLPPTIASIGNRAFRRCSGLAGINLPEGLADIDTWAFSYCSGLMGITIPSTVVNISLRGFAFCDGLTTVTLPAGLTSLGAGVFANCGKLQSILVEAGNPNYVDVDGVVFSADLTTLVQYPTGRSGSYAIPPGTTTVIGLSFNGSNGLTALTIPLGVTTIYYRAFGYCSALNSISVEAGNPAYADVDGVLFNFAGTHLIQFPGARTGDYAIPAGITDIDGYAFAGCSGLTGVTIPAGVTGVANSAFNDCTGLGHAIFRGDAPVMGTRVFENTALEFTVYYLAGSSGFTWPSWDGWPTIRIDESIHPAATWLLSNGYPYDTNLDQDLNGDGVTLLMAYALNLDPDRNPGGSIPRPTRGPNSMSLTFYAASPGVTYTVWTSTNLQNWVTEGVVLSDLNPNGYRTAMVDRNSPRRFLRLGVELKAPPLDLDQLLAALRADKNAAMEAQSESGGWPASVDGGYLFVSCDPAFTRVAGDHDGWAGTPMNIETGFAWLVLPAPPGSRYKFTDTLTFVADPWSRAYHYDSAGLMSQVRSGAGHLERFFNVTDGRVGPRTVRVWLPPQAPTHVLYVHDGQNLFNPDAVWGGWHLDESTPPSMLIVGIDSTAERIDDYTHVSDDIGGIIGGNAAEYAAFVNTTVRSLIAATYGEPDKVGTMGSSIGGVAALYIADRYPDHYDFVASLSGTVGWGSIGPGVHNETIIERYAAAGHRPFAIYLDSGGHGNNATGCIDSDEDGIEDDTPTATDNYCENRQFHAILLDAGYTDDVDLWYWWEPDAPSNEAAWAARVFRPLTLFSGL